MTARTPGPAAKRKTLYWYKVTHVTGSMRSRVLVGDHLGERSFMGDCYTWEVAKLTTGKVTGTVTGVFVNRGKLPRKREARHA